ncbi:MAG: hypothetical protein K6G12_04065 [Lachnospiraceae bacterium]|nr:hypothetical protein [Lachnospiraceae bacterium]
MLSMIFAFALIWAIWKITVLGIKLTWGVMKFFFSIVLFPLVIIGIFIAGLTYIALPVIIIAGIIALIAGKTSVV